MTFPTIQIMIYCGCESCVDIGKVDTVNEDLPEFDISL